MRDKTIDLNAQAGGGVRAICDAIEGLKAWNVEFIRSEIILASTREDAEEIAEDFKRKQEMVGRIEEAD